MPRRFPTSSISTTSRWYCIDVQRDFCLPGGFAESLGNNLDNIAPCIPVIANLQTAFRKAGLPVIHTKECHKPDMSDLPTAKRDRGNPKIKRGDPGPMGRILIDGEAGSDFIPENAPEDGELVIPKPYPASPPTLSRTRESFPEQRTGNPFDPA